MRPALSASDWESTLESFPQAHILQTTAWGELKAAFGWEVARLAEGGSSAQILIRRLPLGLRFAYIPKGPLGDWFPHLLPALDDLCRRQRAFMLKIEPDDFHGAGKTTDLKGFGLRCSPHTVQPRQTLMVDLRAGEDELLARMHPKTRYNIRLAGRKGVQVRPWSDLESFAKMMEATAARNEFGAHVPAYYRRAYELFHPSGACELLVAKFEGTPLAALMVFARGARAWYFYGASTTQHRNRMPTYLLQWEAMRWARARGCISYDLWGIPDADPEALEQEFTSRRDGLWGVYRFKRGFGGSVSRAPQAWDRPYSPGLYRLYHLYLKLHPGRFV